MHKRVSRRANFLVRLRFFRINSTRFCLLAAASLLCFVANLYFAPALLSRRQSSSPPAAAILPITPDARGEHSLAGRPSISKDVKAGIGGVAETRVKEAYGKLPISFEENAGQHDGKVKYSARGSGFQLFLTSDEAVLSLSKTSTKDRRGHAPQAGLKATEPDREPEGGAVLRMKLVGANRRAHVKGEDRLAAQSNYFFGATPENWHTGVAMFEKVRYAEVYPGVDVVYYGNQRQLEYDFVLAPYVNPDRIKFKFDGERALHLDAEGHLSIQTEGGFVRQEKPVIYQLVGDRRQEIAGRYEINASGEIGFKIEEYDHSRPLVIDPVLSYSTYLGGTDADQALAIALDQQGNTYITGWAYSKDFPTTHALQAAKGDDFYIDAFVSKLNADGSALVYSTYLGGDDEDSGQGIAVDAAGNAYVTGYTGSKNFPRSLGTLQGSGAGSYDGFVTKLNATGDALVYSTYLGGENFDRGFGIAVDAAGNAYVTGETDSNTFAGGVSMPKQGNPVYKSGDAAVTWSARRSGLLEANVAGLTIDPTNSGILYAAGESGVFKSTDGGAFWSRTGQGSAAIPTSATSVVVDPATPTTLYASTFGGIYKSANGGDQWNYSGVGMGSSAGLVFCLAIDPNNSSTLYAGTADRVYKSVNGGASWVRAGDGFAQFATTIRKIIIDPSDSKILYAATGSGVYKSVNGATTWAALRSNVLFGRVNWLAISPINPTTIYAGASTGVFKSTDGGLNWVSSNDGLRSPLPNNGSYVPPITAIVISPVEATTIYASSPDGGVFKSTDGGAHWAVSSNGLANRVVTSLAIDHTAAATLYASTNTFADAFVIKINATGTGLGYVRCLGGNENDLARGIAVDPGGNAYITGETNSTNFPTLNPVQANGGFLLFDAFVTKLGSDGSTLYSTYLGGGTGSDQGRAIAVSEAGNAYITGSTTSTDFPTAGPRLTSNTSGTEIFVSKLGISGSVLDYSILHGGDSTDQGFGIALDRSGNAFVTGATSSSNFPIMNGTQAASGGGSDVFVLKLNPTSEVIYSTYVGGSYNDQGFGIAADNSGAAYIAGSTTSPDFPTASPLQPSARGDFDAFVAKISTSVDLSVTMTDAPDPVMLGGHLTYTIKVTNVGELTATGVRLSDTLPAGSVLVSAGTSAGTCSGTGSINCALGTFAGGESATVTIVIKPPAVRTITHTASVTSNEQDGNTANNTASEKTQVNFADLKVSKFLSNDLIKRGGKVIYLVRVTNLGGGTTGAITLTDHMPAELTFTACTPTGRFVCGGAGNNRTATLPSLAVGESESIILSAVANASVANDTLISNTANISFDLPDPNPENNQSTAAATVTDMPCRPMSNGKIAYTSNAAGAGVQVVNADGTGKMTYRDLSGDARSTAWSPDGSKIAFRTSSGSGQVRVINADGTGLKIIDEHVSDETNVTWSPRGNHLAYVGRDGSIYVAQADGTGLTRLINDSTSIRSIDWSPDGQKFAYIRGGALYVMDIDGSNRSKLTGDPANVSYSPSWSPDGSKILFMRDYAAYTINADGTDEMKLFNVATPEATWSPDGTKIVFIHNDSVATINLDGTGQTEVTKDSITGITHYVRGPDWQPLPNASPTPTPTPRPTYSISGHVARNAFPNSSVQVVLSGTINVTTNVDDDGNYSFIRLPAGGNYTITPVNQSYSFAPSARTFNNLSANQTNVNFTLTGATNYSISGHVIDTGGAPLGNVEITLNRGGSLQGTVRTMADGAYAFNNLGSGQTYTIFVSSSSRTQYDFAPEVRTFSLTRSEIVDFVGTPKNSFQFSTDHYIVDEGAGHATVVVTRTGIPSTIATAASVTVQTFDDPAAVPCDPELKKPDGTAYPEGAAYARCDYATTIETLLFAPGETQKSVNIPIIDDTYDEVAETVPLRLSNAIGAPLGTLRGVQVIIHDNDSGRAENPTKTTSFFVRQHYLDFLSREPEAGEPWSGVLQRCADPFNLDAQNPSAGCDRIIVSQSFFGSPEFRLKGFFVYKFYRVAFGRLPEYAEIISDMSALSGQTAAEVYARRAALPVGFIGRQEFTTRFDALSDTAYVAALLDRYNLQQITTPDPQHPEGSSKVVLTRAELVNRLGTPVSSTQGLTRAQVLRAIVESDEVGGVEYNRAFVAMQYYGYLRRTPEEEGYQAWLRVITEDSNNVRIMVNGFMNSAEYRLRFGHP